MTRRRGTHHSTLRISNRTWGDSFDACEETMVAPILAGSSLADRGKDVLRDDLELHVVAARREIVRAERGHDEVELRNDHDRLSPRTAGPERAHGAILVRIVVDPPQISEMKAAQRVERRGGAFRVVTVENPVSVPRSAVEHELAELEQVARAEARAAGAVRLAAAIERPDVAVDVHGPGDEAIEEIERRPARGPSDHA